MPSASRERLTTVGGLALVAAFICFVTAIIFGFISTVQLGPSGGSNEAPNVTSAGAACGFAVASGLCMIAAAVAEGGARRHEARAGKTTSSPSDLPPHEQ